MRLPKPQSDRSRWLSLILVLCLGIGMQDIASESTGALKVLVDVASESGCPDPCMTYICMAGSGAGAHVEVSGTRFHAVSGKYGSCVFAEVPAGGHTVVVTRSDCLPESAHVNVVPGETAQQHFTLWRAGPRSARGVVKDANTGKPLRNARVQLDTAGPGMTTWFDGNYLLQNLPARGIRLRATRAGYEPDVVDVSLRANVVTDIDFSLYDTTEPRVVTGVVFDGKTGRPVDSARVRSPSTRSAAYTDWAGQFAIAVRPMTASITVEHSGYAPREFGVGPLRPSRWTTAIPMYPSGTAGLAVSVCDAKTGELLVGTDVCIDGVPRTAADAHGSCLISDIPPGAHKVNVSYMGYTDQTVNVVIEPGKLVTVDFRLQARCI